MAQALAEELANALERRSAPSELLRIIEQCPLLREAASEPIEALAATSAILGVIAASPTDIQPVLDTVVESAGKLCDAYDTTICLRNGDVLTVAAHHGEIPLDFAELPINRDLVTSRAVVDRVPVHVRDLTAEEDEFPQGSVMARRLGFKTILAMPLMRQGEAIGALVIRRDHLEPFSQKQIDLLKTFADQAVIAIENVRLFKQVQTRTAELTEALEQQTSTGAILHALAASPTDVQPVLLAVAKSAAQLCDAYDAIVSLRVGDILSSTAHYGPLPITTEPWSVSRGWVSGRAVADRKPVHVRDIWQAEREFPEGYALAQELGHRTMLAVPLLSEDQAIGALIIRRREVRSFNQKQIDLLSTFADQAVIAIRNVRLFEEVQARNRELPTPSSSKPQPAPSCAPSRARRRTSSRYSTSWSKAPPGCSMRTMQS